MKEWSRRLAIILTFTLSALPLDEYRMPWFEWSLWMVGIFPLTALVGWMCHHHRLRRKVPFQFHISERVWLCGAGLLTLLICTTVAWTVFAKMPRIADESLQYIQARTFADWQLYARAHPLPEFFDVFRIIRYEGRYFSMYPPGHALVMVPFIWLGIAWLMGPLLAAVGNIALYFLAREIAGVRVARIATVLLMFSQVYIYMGSSYMNHMTAFVCTVAFSLFYIRMHKHQRILNALLAGSSLGMLFITRPQVAAPLILPFLFHWLFTKWRLLLTRQSLLCMASGGAIFSIFILFYLYYNLQTTGNPFTTGYEMVYVPDFSLGRFLTREGWAGLGSDLLRMAVQMHEMHLFLFDWPISSLVFVPVLFLLRLHGAYAYLLLATSISVALSLILHQHYLPFFPPRYLFETSGFFVLLTAMAIARLPVWIMRRYPNFLPLRELRLSCLYIPLVLFAYTIPFKVIPFYISSADGSLYNKHAHARMILGGITQTPALLLYGGDESFYFQTAVATEGLPPLPNNKVILARDLGEKNEALMNMYPDRYVYIVRGETLRLYRKPLTAEQ